MSDISSESSSSFDENTLIGKTLHSKYILIYKIGKGAFSTVWLCMDVKSKQYYAIKIIYPEDYNIGLAEIELLKKIKKSKCQYFNHLVDSFTHELNDENYCCMVFELLAGSVYDIMKYGKYSNGLPLNVVKSIVRQLLIAMNTLTKDFNLLHTDIKPENILVVGLSNKMNEIISVCNKHKQFKKKPNKKIIDELNEKFIEISDKYRDSNSENKNLELLSNEYINNISVKLSDFGNCLSLEKKTYKIQTRYYRAPEVILECEFSDKCDLWSVGCLIYELLTNKPLFDPVKERRFYTDRSHLYDMMCLLGEIPQSLIDKSEKRTDLFKKNGLLKGISETMNCVSVESKLTDKLTIADLKSTTSFINLLLNYLPKKRSSITELLEHCWIN
ncbi:serine/threonine protein kinase [Indivirus ILV1]|uniref:non-specific serine/threonine protein kinase n=1 Tax=Indivirus ILV1 TaxID=1977633 RepID=A0A1V0SCS9_9VIRU|nr:serine/threonine protein kinase [Indivirus ILV1]